MRGMGRECARSRRLLRSFSEVGLFVGGADYLLSLALPPAARKTVKPLLFIFLYANYSM